MAVCVSSAASVIQMRHLTPNRQRATFFKWIEDFNFKLKSPPTLVLHEPVVTFFLLLANKTNNFLDDNNPTQHVLFPLILTCPFKVIYCYLNEETSKH